MKFVRCSIHSYNPSFWNIHCQKLLLTTKRINSGKINNVACCRFSPGIIVLNANTAKLQAVFFSLLKCASVLFAKINNLTDYFATFTEGVVTRSSCLFSIRASFTCSTVFLVFTFKVSTSEKFAEKS